MKKLTILILSLFTAASAHSTTAPLEVTPSDVDSETLQITGPHLVYTGESYGNGRLLITIGGTNSRPSDFGRLHQVALDLGYQVLAIDYPNSVISTTCRDSADLACFDKFRREVVEGGDISEIVSVDRANSLEYRITSLVESLRQRDSRWSAFYRNGALDWSRVVLVGHSQGSGHAAYLSKLHEVARVLVVAGPQDNFDPECAKWLEIEGATPRENYFALLHKEDFFKQELQLAAFQALLGAELDPSKTGQAIVSEKPVHDPHNALLSDEFTTEWRELLDIK